jgi:hypothetical protein
MPGILWKLHAGNKYAHLLALLVIFFVLTPLFGQTEHTAPVISFVFLCILVFTMRAIELHRRTRHVCVGLLLLGFALDMLSYTHATLLTPCGFSATALYLLVMLFTIATMVQRLFTTTQVTWDTILGGISTYLLLGFFWALLYFTLRELHVASFRMAESGHPMYLIYFSFTTLATVGYGDIVPTNGVAMMLSNFESLVGQLFLTVFIARLIGLHLAHHGR